MRVLTGPSERPIVHQIGQIVVLHVQPIVQDIAHSQLNVGIRIRPRSAAGLNNVAPYGPRFRSVELLILFAVKAEQSNSLLVWAPTQPVNTKAQHPFVEQQYLPGMDN